MLDTEKNKSQLIETVESLNQQVAESRRTEIEYKKVAATLRHQVEASQLLTSIATRFINQSSAGIEPELNQALQALGEFAGVDRCHLFLFAENRMKMSRVFEWCAAGLESSIDDFLEITLADIPWCLAKLTRCETIDVPGVVELPPEARIEKKLFQRKGIQSFLSVPLLRDGLAIGCLGFDTVWQKRAWSEQDKTLLKMAADIVVRVLDPKRLQHEDQAGQEWFRRVVSSIVDHIYVTKITKAGDHINIHLSPHAEKLTGYSVEELEVDWSLWSEKIIHVDDRAAAADQAARLAQGEDSEMEYRLVRADGRIIWVRDRATVKAEGSSKIIYGLVTDITKQKVVELEREWLTNELRDINLTLDERVWARTAELQAIIDAVGEGIVVTDLDGVIQYLNPAQERLTGYSETEALGQTPRLWKSNQQDSTFFTQMWQTILAGQTWRGELINKRKNGTLYEALLTITPIFLPDGQPLGFVGVQHDITSFREMDRLKSEFISTAAHELRTPLTSIRGFSEILLTRRKLTDERKKRYLTFINQQAEALAAIIDDLLDLSRLEAGEGFEVIEEVVDIAAIIKQIIFGFQENHPDHHYHLTGAAEWPAIKGDPAKLAQLFKNLISNATKYSPNGGNVSVQATIESDHDLLRLTLTDEGIGMMSEQQVHIFERFYRADASNTATGGTGLGMTISRLIVERHRGKVWVESEYGAGTTIHILLPLPDRAPYVLVIEDDEALLEIQRRHLELQGFSVLTAEEGRRGLQLAQTCLPNLILLDLALPGMNGFMVLEKLQARDVTRNVPVIITSAMDSPEEIERAIASGVIDYLVKPYTMNDLTVRVNRAVTRARQGREMI
ncbi:MAG TPA: PAS domain S-box protein [Anaerolineae bacterium]